MIKISNNKIDYFIDERVVGNILFTKDNNLIRLTSTIVKPEERGCYLFLRGIFFGAEMTEKERVWKILKNYKNITKVFETNNK